MGLGCGNPGIVASLVPGETVLDLGSGGGPAITYTAYIAAVDEDACIDCEACVDICPMEAVRMTDGIARVDEARCIGCGVCAGHCDTEAIALKRTGQREVCVMPEKRVA